VSFVIDRLSRAGTETQMLALIRELNRTRIEPSLVLLDGTDAESRALEPDCPVVRLGVTRLASRSAASAARRLAAEWAARRPDVVQAYFLDSAYFAAVVARWSRVTRVVRVRNNLGYWLTPRHRLLGRLVRPLVDVTLTNTPVGRQQLEREGEPAAVIPNGVDLDRFRDIRPPDVTGSVRVGCVANLRPVKNLDGLLRAAKSVSDRFSRVTFTIAGDGDQRTELERLRDRLGLRGRFEIVGPTADVPGFLSGCAVAVLPSHSEGMSNAVLEYMAAGRAVVATAVGATPELLDGGRCGLLAPPGDDAALASAIGRLLVDQRLAAELGAAARRRAEREYSRAAMVRRFEDFYAGLMSSGGRAPMRATNSARRAATSFSRRFSSSGSPP
jgi:glycosyltransferase involved in cell wall biosynthesis